VDVSDLVRLEERGWAALSRGEGGSFYGEYLAGDAVMVFPVGVYDKAAAIAALVGAAPWASYELDDLRAVPLGDDAGLVTYHAWARRERDPQPYEAFMTSVYRREENTWRLVVHQQTPVATPA
jgi:hypothetical protein